MGGCVCLAIWIAFEWLGGGDVREELVGLRRREVNPRGVCHRAWVVEVVEVVAWRVGCR